jgi:hypothetical protein
MKRKLWFQKLSVKGPRVAVKAHLPWPLRIMATIIVLALAGAGGLALYEHGRTIGGPDLAQLSTELEKSRSLLREAQSERTRNASAAAQAENQLKVERAAQEQLEAQLKLMENDNARLREDLAFFESLLPMPAASKGVVIRSFRVQPDSEAEPNTMRYRLLVQQSGKPERDFVGTVSLKVSLQQGGRPWVLQIPDPRSPESATALSFRHYQRVEGTFTLPAGAVIRSVQVTIEANGQAQAQQTFATQ